MKAIRRSALFFGFLIILITCLGCTDREKAEQLAKQSKEQSVTDTAVTKKAEQVKKEPEPVTKEEVAALRTKDDPESIRKLITALGSIDLALRKEAHDALLSKGIGIVDIMLADFAGRNVTVQDNVMKLIEKLDPDWVERKSAKSTVPFFIKRLVNDNAGIRENAQHTLENIGEPAMEGLILAMRGADMHISDTAGRILMKIDIYWLKSEVGQRSIPDFVKALQDENAYIKRNSKITLTKMGEDTFKHLIPELIGEDWELQKVALWIIREIDPYWFYRDEAKSMIPAFIKALESENEAVRRGAVIALGQTRNHRAMPLLIAELKDDFIYARVEAEKALKDITSEDFGADQAKWRAWWDKSEDTFKANEKKLEEEARLKEEKEKLEGNKTDEHKGHNHGGGH